LAEILDLLSKQVAPPTALIGFTGILDEKNFALNRAGGLLATDMPNAKVEKLAPTIPQDLFKELSQIDAMFEEVSGIGNVLQGKGEAGVRSSGHASQLARMGSSRAKKRALVVEDSLEKLATLYLKCMQVYDNTHFKDSEGLPVHCRAVHQRLCGQGGRAQQLAQSLRKTCGNWRSTCSRRRLLTKNLCLTC
jgi:hypothetical protein